MIEQPKMEEPKFTPDEEQKALERLHAIRKLGMKNEREFDRALNDFLKRCLNCNDKHDVEEALQELANGHEL